MLVVEGEGDIKMLNFVECTRHLCQGGHAHQHKKIPMKKKGILN